MGLLIGSHCFSLICIIHLLIRHPFTACTYSFCSIFFFFIFSLNNKHIISISSINTVAYLVQSAGFRTIYTVYVTFDNIQNNMTKNPKTRVNASIYKVH